MFEATLAALQSASGEAVKTLLTITKDAQAAPGSRVAAARSILEFSLKAKTEIEIEERLRALEQMGGLHDKPNSWTN